MAESTNTTPSEGGRDLFVAFWHDGRVEASAICTDPSAALTFAQAILKTRDGLYVGDQLTVDDLPRQNLIERGLA